MKRALALLIGMMICTAGARGADVKITAVTSTGLKDKPTAIFNPDTPKVFVLMKIQGVKKGDKVRAVWVADDVGDAAPANTKMVEKTNIMEGVPTEGDFSCLKPRDGWPPGKYHVDIYVNDELVTTAKFTVEGAKKTETQAKASAGGDVKVTVEMTADPKGKPATVFPADTPKLFAQFKITDAKKGDKMRAVLIAEKVADAPPNTKILERDRTLEDENESGGLTLTPPDGSWAAGGKYHVDFYVNEKLAATAKFTIEEAKETVEKRPIASKEKAVKYPEDDPAFTIEFPADWTHSVNKEGNLECKAGDDDTYSFSLLPLEDVRNSKELKAALPEVAKLMAKEMKLKNFALGDYVTGKNPNGVLFSGIMGDGKVDGIEFNVMVHAFEPQKGKYYAIVTAATKESDADHEKEYDEVTDSVTPIEE